MLGKLRSWWRRVWAESAPRDPETLFGERDRGSTSSGDGAEPRVESAVDDRDA